MQLKATLNVVVFFFFFFNDKWGFPDRCYWVPKFQSYVGHLESTRGIKKAILPVGNLIVGVYMHHI